MLGIQANDDGLNIDVKESRGQPLDFEKNWG